MGPNGPKMPISGQKGQKFLIFKEGSKNFGTHITENHLGTLIALFFGPARDKMGPKGQFLAKNVKFGHFWAKNSFFQGSE